MLSQSEIIARFLVQYEGNSEMQNIIKVVRMAFARKLRKTKERIEGKSNAELFQFAEEKFVDIFKARVLREIKEDENSEEPTPTPTPTPRRHTRSCEYCEDTIFSTLKEFESHVARHAKQRPDPSPPRPKLTKPFKCTVDGCSKRFTTKGNLERHGLIHAGLKPFQCNFCNKTFIHKENLKIHQKIHGGVKAFSCKHCPKKFLHSGHLIVHVRIHNGFRPFGCHHCQKRFNISSNLKRHVRLHAAGEKLFVHEEQREKKLTTQEVPTSSEVTLPGSQVPSGEKSHKCDRCDKGFAQKSHLTRHMSVHTGVRPFSCTVCGKVFRRRDNLAAHQKRKICTTLPSNL